jgi:selenocysteine-specific elongation factor
MNHVVFGTAGHIDHGKSALVLALTGTDPDRLKEEQARGITIDLGFAHWQTPDLSVAFVDVPGHERFVKNMLAGVGGIDAVLFVIAADESVMPQTREHFEICRLLHVPAGIIVLTKSDLVDDDVIALVTLEARELVSGSFLEHAPIIPVSARTGAGLDALRQAMTLVGQTSRRRSAGGPIRLPVDRVFTVKGFGTVVTGTLVSGTLRPDRDLVALPSGRDVKVRGLQVHGASQSAGEAGQRVAVNLGGVEITELQRGDTLVTPGEFVATRVCDARIEVIASERALRHGARVRVHQGTSEVLGRVAVSSVVATRDDEVAVSAAEIPPGRSAYVRLRLESPLVLTRGDRFILRAYSPAVTIAGGCVLDPAVPRIGIRTAAGRDRFQRLDPLAVTQDGGSADRRALDVLLAEAGLTGVPMVSLVARLGLTPAEADGVAGRGEAEGTVVRIEHGLVARSVVDQASAATIDAVRAFHVEQPLLEGLSREQVRERLFAHAGPGVFERVVGDLSAAGRLVARDRLALATHRVEVVGEEKTARDRLEALYRDAGLTPPDLGAAAAALVIRPAMVESMATLLVRQRVLVKVDGVLFHEQVLATLKVEIAGLKSVGSTSPVTLDVAAFKQRCGVSRKYAIPLLEYLDRERVTRRVGDSRVIL